MSDPTEEALWAEAMVDEGTEDSEASNPTEPELKTPDPAEPETPVQEPPKEGDLDYKTLFERSQSELSRVKDELSTSVGRLRGVQDAAAQRLAALEARLPAAEPSPSEEDVFLDKFREEYDTSVVKAIDIIAGRKAQAAITEFTQSQFVPEQQRGQTLASQTHYALISQQGFPDVYEINESTEFNDWIAKRPVHLRPAYDYIRDHGDAEAVVSMLREYRSQTAPAPSAPPASPAPSASPAPPASPAPSALAVPRTKGAFPVPAGQIDDVDEKTLWAAITAPNK